MDYNYTLLGLREDATLEDAKSAYEYWKKKYKAADYDDEPEYARRKIAQLTEAYSNVCNRIAGYVPIDIKDSNATKNKVKAIQPKRLKTSEDNFFSEPFETDKIVKENRKYHSESNGLNIAGKGSFLDGLKSVAKDFLDELDLQHGYAPTFAAGQNSDDYDYDIIDDE